MPRPRAILDPYCFLNGKGKQVRLDDADENLRALANYARALDVAVWRFKDGKLGLTSPRYKLGPKGGLIFGEEDATLVQTATQAFNALHQQSFELQRTIALTNAVERAVIDKAFPRPAGATDPVEFITRELEAAVGGEIGGAVRAIQALPALDETARYLGGRSAMGAIIRAMPKLVNSSSALKRMGAGGRGLAVIFRRRNELRDRILGRVLGRLKEIKATLTDDEVAFGFADYVEKGIVPNEARRPILEQARRGVKEINDEFYETLQGLGVHVKPRIGVGETNPTGEYFTHRYDVAALRDRRATDQLIDDTISHFGASGMHLTREEALEVLERQGLGTSRDLILRRLQEKYTGHMTGGKELTREQAETVLDNYITRHAERISGNIERARRLDVEGYIKDMFRAYTTTWMRNANRVADWTVFGPKDRNVHALLDLVEASEGSKALTFAREIYHLEIGRDRPQFSSTFMQELYNWQAVKLSLAVLANATQPQNTLMLRGLRPFLVAAGRIAALRPRDVAAIAERSGALPVQLYSSSATVQIAGELLSEVRDQGMIAMVGRADLKTLPGKLFVGASGHVRDFALKAFRLVENYNRAHAQLAGEVYFDQLVEVAQRRGLGVSKLDARFRGLDLDPHKVLRAAQHGDRQVLDEMRILAGQRTSNTTQFRADIQHTPHWANSEPGRFALQFKGYAFNQVTFMLTQLASKHVPLDQKIRAWAMVLTAYPAVGIALTKLRAELMGPTLSSDILDEALFDPGIQNVMAAGLVGMTMAGGLGIIADIGMTAATRNRFALLQFGVPPAMGTLFNVVDAVASAGNGILTGDSDELAKARKPGLREFGGMGAVVDQAIERWQGVADTPEPLLPALRRIFR